MVGPREQLGFAASGSSLYVTGGRAEAGATTLDRPVRPDRSTDRQAAAPRVTARSARAAGRRLVKRNYS